MLGPDEAAFIAERDHFYLATVGENGWPYLQHRGGPPGFLHVLDPVDGHSVLGWADLRGNRQYLSVGNLGTSPGCRCCSWTTPANSGSRSSARPTSPTYGTTVRRPAGAAERARSSGQGGTVDHRDGARLRLELSATHHASLQRGRTRTRSHPCATNSPASALTTALCASTARPHPLRTGHP
ncbi:pyridoxamine 5'-phosphate oxidase family protein [Micromonospora sp. M12]